MTLRQFEREAARKRDEMSEHTKSKVQDKQLKETEKDKNLLMVRCLKAKDSCVCLHFCWWPPVTRICSRLLLLGESWRVSIQEPTQQLDKTLLLPGNIEKNLQRAAALWEQKSNSLRTVTSVLTPHASDTYFKSQHLYTEVTDLTNGLSVSCQRDCCLFWRSSTLSVLQW